MAERSKLLYIIVEDAEKGKKPLSSSFRYTRPVLQSTLQLIGCKARHAFKISKRIFEILRGEIPCKGLERSGAASHDFPRHDFSRHLSDSEIDSNREYSLEDIKKAAEENEIRLKEITRKLYDVQKKRSTVILDRVDFMEVVCNAMSEYRYLGPNQRNDFALACKIREKKASVTILLCGTSGCGKSTLSTLLASRLGITTVVSTDSIRHMMRSFVDEKENPLLWASTYSAGEHLDPVAVAEAKAKKIAKKIATRLVNSHLENSQFSRALSNGRENGVMQRAKEHSLNAEIDIKGKAPVTIEGNIPASSMEVTVSSKTMAVQGYKAQSEMVIDSLDRLITSWEQKCESVIVEGVHLSLNFVMGLVKKHPSIIPFMVYISNEEKHLERFAVRAKYMTLDPAKNKYVKYIRNIRAIQDYQCKRADKHLIPKVNNTNMDQSIASIHATIFACLRRREGGEPYYDETTNTVKMVDDEYKNQCAANSLGSKGMLQVIRRRGSSRQLMALMNTDGSVAKAWPFETARKLSIPNNNNGEENSCSMYNCEALEVSPVNLHFGNFGLSAWQNDMGGTSYSGSIDGLSSRGDGIDYQSSHRSSRYGSSCSSSPRLVEGTEKELLNESRVSGSDEEQEEEVLDFDSEEELNEGREQQREEDVEGSVDDQSIGSEEEDDYAAAAAADQEDNVADDGRLDSLECPSRTIFRVSSENGRKLHKLFHQNPDSVNSGVPLNNEADRTQHSIVLNSHTEVTGREANGKHLHGRSKSLPPLTATYSSFWDRSFLIESTKRV